jgi:twitching motility protein PilU
MSMDDPTQQSAVPARIDVLLGHMARIDASDLYLTANSPPIYRVDGVGYPGKMVFDAEQVARLTEGLLTPSQLEEFRRTSELNLAIALPEGRFRVNIFRQRGATGLVARLVRSKVRTLEELALPDVLKTIILQKRGLVLVVGATGSGKSTTLSGMIDHRNSAATGHIVTVEDPIETVHSHKKCVVTQREVGVDTMSYADALKSALRQAPDLILIGEIRDKHTMEAAIEFAETGHLCVSTLHANNANQALERILNFFPTERHHEIRLQLSMNLRSIVSQRLVPTTTGGRAAALEILIDTPRIRELVKKGETDLLKDAMEQGGNEGCATFDMALFDLYTQGRIAEDEALRTADSPNNLRMKIDRFNATGETIERKEELRLVPLGPIKREAQRVPPGFGNMGGLGNPARSVTGTR